MSYNDISSFQTLIFDVVTYLEDQNSQKLKVTFFKGNHFCLWGIIHNRIWVSDTYEVNRFGVIDLIQDLEIKFNLDLQDFTGLVDRKQNLACEFELEA
ncbi:MAG: hypothetical protein SPL83_11000 [Succinivibrio sp.]|nr:hypothetical protein [Succinivibrio sp.]MDY6262211.1 hypothetical protein [Succinivibrio sp.]